MENEGNRGKIFENVKNSLTTTRKFPYLHNITNVESINVSSNNKENISFETDFLNIKDPRVCKVFKKIMIQLKDQIQKNNFLYEQNIELQKKMKKEYENLIKNSHLIK